MGETQSFLFAFTGKITSREGRFEYSDLSSLLT